MLSSAGIIREPARPCRNALHNATESYISGLDSMLWLGPRAPCMRTLGMPNELELVVRPQFQRLLEVLSDLDERLSTRAVTTLALAGSPGPQANSEECLSDVDHHAHNLVVVVFFESLADGRELCREPQIINIDSLLILELERPLAAMLVLRILPFRANTTLKEMVVGFECKLGAGSDVILKMSESYIPPDLERSLQRLPRTPQPNQTSRPL